MTDSLSTFLALIQERLQQQAIFKLLLTQYRGAEAGLQCITIRPIHLQNDLRLSFTYGYKTRDTTQNLLPEEGMSLIQQCLSKDFRAAHLYDSESETQLEISKKGKAFLTTHALSKNTYSQLTHDRSKNRFVDLDRPYLKALGVTDQQGRLVPAMSAKWKQINKFIEIVGHALDSIPSTADKPLHIVDFGSGKGYLTFALYDYLHHSRHCSHHRTAKVTGVELRENLVTLCNQTATALEYHDLTFRCGDIKHQEALPCDVMIALHACDTATDYALHYGIRNGATLLICSPCCHKQIRPQLHSPSILKPMLQYGVHMGQEAEMITDSLRALLLEANGYNTNIFEFISLEHTDKNKMILGIKDAKNKNPQEVLEQISAIKTFYGIQQHCLETLLQRESE